MQARTAPRAGPGRRGAIKEADVLYISFRRPQHATKTVEIDEDILVRKDGADIVGLTILNASTKR